MPPTSLAAVRTVAGTQFVLVQRRTSPSACRTCPSVPPSPPRPPRRRPPDGTSCGTPELHRGSSGKCRNRYFTSCGRSLYFARIGLYAKYGLPAGRTLVVVELRRPGPSRRRSETALRRAPADPTSARTRCADPDSMAARGACAAAGRPSLREELDGRRGAGHEDAARRTSATGVVTSTRMSRTARRGRLDMGTELAPPETTNTPMTAM